MKPFWIINEIIVVSIVVFKVSLGLSQEVSKQSSHKANIPTAFIQLRVPEFVFTVW